MFFIVLPNTEPKIGKYGAKMGEKGQPPFANFEGRKKILQCCGNGAHEKKWWRWRFVVSNAILVPMPNNHRGPIDGPAIAISMPSMPFLELRYTMI